MEIEIVIRLPWKCSVLGGAATASCFGADAGCASTASCFGAAAGFGAAADCLGDPAGLDNTGGVVTIIPFFN